MNIKIHIIYVNYLEIKFIEKVENNLPKFGTLIRFVHELQLQLLQWVAACAAVSVVVELSIAIFFS